jgi:CubicO group peptidase (beta-lactamase class C family)/phage-related protein
MGNFKCEPISRSRREVLHLGRGALAAGAPGILLGVVQPVSAQIGSQNEWRFCKKCYAMFFNGYDQSGVCPTGGNHSAQGFDFYIEYDSNERNPIQQFKWRFCNKCFTMFWHGPDRTQKIFGVCPKDGGSHVPQGYDFGLFYTNETQRNPPLGPNYQPDWRFCGKCNALFYHGYRSATGTGVCPKDGKGHLAAGWTFHISYRNVPPKLKAPSGKLEDRINTAFRNWLNTYKITNASLTVMLSGGIVGKFGYGQRNADSIVAVASLSKAITGVCIATLVDAGRLGFTDTIGTRLRAFLTNHPPADTRASNITIEHLLRHRSGLGTDPTQGAGMSTLPNRDSADEAIAQRALAVNLSSNPGSTYFYNNANYSLLGMVIREITGEAYEAYCHRILLGRGASRARIGAGLRAMGAFGGWEISAAEYASFGRAFDKGQRLLSTRAHTFIDGGTYGLGVNVVRTATGRNVFHFGDWQSSATTPSEIGAFFALWDNNVSIVANYDRHVSDAARTALDNALRNAAYGN